MFWSRYFGVLSDGFLSSFKSKKSPTVGPTVNGPPKKNPEYLVARSQLPHKSVGKVPVKF